jgi:multiple antibiotic resistance protein
LSSLFTFDLVLFGEAFILLFAILDPIGAVPIFIALTEGYAEKRRRIVRQSVILAAAILYVFASVGWVIFQILGITIDDFRIAGGIILFVVAYEHLSGREEKKKKQAPEEVAAFPLATPLLAGPGAISSVIILANPPYGLVVTFLVITANAYVAYLVLTRTDWIQRIFGAGGTTALTRITALLIAALAVSFVRDGITNIVTSLK